MESFLVVHPYNKDIVRPRLDDEYVRNYVGYSFEPIFKLRIGEVLEKTNQHETPFYCVYYISKREETNSITKTYFSFVETRSQTYANRLSEWLCKPENIMVYSVEPVLPMEEIEKEEIENAKRLDNEAIEESRKIQELTNQTIMMLFPEFRDKTYAVPTKEVEQNAAIMYGLFR